MLLQLRHSLAGNLQHVILCSEVQTSSRTRLDAGRFQPTSYAIGAERALVDFFRRRIEFRHIERTSGNAELAADAVLFLKINDAVAILHDRPVSRTCRKASRIRTM